MKKVKYIISFCSIFIGLLIIGESHIFYLDNFYNQYANTPLYLQNDTTSDEMIADIVNSATSSEVEVLTFVRSQLNRLNLKNKLWPLKATTACKQLFKTLTGSQLYGE